MCGRLGLPKPDPKTIISRIRAEKGFDLECKRVGKKAARQIYEARPGKLSVKDALALVQIDHTLADINLVSDDDLSLVIGRPWLTLAIDVATRAVIGYHLTMNAPSSISVAMCVAHMMLPKRENEKEPGLWPMHGQCEAILVDNGKDLRSEAFQRGCEQHGIELRWRPVGEPHYGAHIERLMGTFMQRVHTLPGTTFSNVKQRGNYPSERKACYTLDDFRAWLIEQICRGYHVRHHRALGMPPLVAWERAFQDENGQPVLPPEPIERAALRRDFYPFKYRRLERTGILFDKSRFWAPALAPLIQPERKVKCHYHPDVADVIWVRGDDDILIEATAVAGKAFGEGMRVKLDESKQLELDAVRQLGYDRSDDIRDKAQRNKRRQARIPAEPHTKKRPRFKSRKTAFSFKSTPARPAVPLNRAAIIVEVLDA